ncbi:hypothetical protein P154DRAFT_528967 [Amniculicola lignicola CBS 123094]|uniref:Uncharacterized protein n=1 Tax=Amniculicola lignicola CBS 123094 TaxID=1392246 RepID=A0A6A5X335_9PLEO|nr:hypothetical protein P154DRAFT_528967 [Amniculicola lignicola CBS 123094]
MSPSSHSRLAAVIAHCTIIFTPFKPLLRCLPKWRPWNCTPKPKSDAPTPNAISTAPPLSQSSSATIIHTPFQTPCPSAESYFDDHFLTHEWEPQPLANVPDAAAWIELQDIPTLRMPSIPLRRHRRTIVQIQAGPSQENTEQQSDREDVESSSSKGFEDDQVGEDNVSEFRPASRISSVPFELNHNGCRAPGSPPPPKSSDLDVPRKNDFWNGRH